MSIVNFSIPTALENRVKAAVKERGFASKAEFFRNAAMQYLESSRIPIYQLIGKAACRADKMVKDALLEYHGGKTKKISSLADFM